MNLIVAQLSQAMRLFLQTTRRVFQYAQMSECYACNQLIPFLKQHTKRAQSASRGFTGTLTSNVKPPSNWLCPTCCELLLTPTRVGCRQCALKLGPRVLNFGWSYCRHCKPTPNPQIKTSVLCDYIPPWSNWITRLKYGNEPEIAMMLADLLAHRLLLNKKDLPDVLIPTPISPEKLKHRGYNQAQLIADHLSKALNRPVMNNVLIKIHETPSQADLSKEQRQSNLDHVMLCREKLNPTLIIGIVDDVITTGSTLKACMSACMKAGATQFHHLAISRTPEPFVSIE